MGQAKIPMWIMPRSSVLLLTAKMFRLQQKKNHLSSSCVVSMHDSDIQVYSSHDGSVY